MSFYVRHPVHFDADKAVFVGVAFDGHAGFFQSLHPFQQIKGNGRPVGCCSADASSIKDQKIFRCHNRDITAERGSGLDDRKVSRYRSLHASRRLHTRRVPMFTGGDTRILERPAETRHVGIPKLDAIAIEGNYFA